MSIFNNFSTITKRVKQYYKKQYRLLQDKNSNHNFVNIYMLWVCKNLINITNHKNF